MSSTALKIVAVVTVLLAMVLAVAGYRMSRQYAESAEQAAEKTVAAPQTLAVVATKPLAAYKQIDRDSVVVAPVAVLPKDYFATVDDVVGKVPLVDVDAGAPVTGRYFKEGNALARIVPEGHQAVSLEINDVIAVGGFLRPGDIVDVLVSLRGGGGIGEPQARILLKQVRVLAYEDRIIDRPQGLPADEDANRQRRQRTVVLAVPDDATTRLMLGTALGEIRLALHGQASGLTEVSDAELGEGGLPLADASTTGADKETPGKRDRVVTAAQLGEVEPPAKKQQQNQPPPRHKIYVYRGSDVQTVLD